MSELKVSSNLECLVFYGSTRLGEKRMSTLLVTSRLFNLASLALNWCTSLPAHPNILSLSSLLFASCPILQFFSHSSSFPFTQILQGRDCGYHWQRRRYFFTSCLESLWVLAYLYPIQICHTSSMKLSLTTPPLNF